MSFGTELIALFRVALLVDEHGAVSNLLNSHGYDVQNLKALATKGLTIRRLLLWLGHLDPMRSTFGQKG